MLSNCIKVYEFGNPEDVLKIERKKTSSLENNELLVRMLARPINPSDLIPIRGSYSHRVSLPHIPGYEGVGIVEHVGRSASPALIGKRVLPLRGEGTWQEYVKTGACFAVPVPDSIDTLTASQLYINPLTAWVTCTEILRLRPSDTLLVNASGSAIGRIYAQLSKVIGFRLIAVTRNDRHTKELMELGASAVVDTSISPLYETIMEITNGSGAHAAIDLVGGSSGNELAFCIRPNGHFLAIGLLSGVQVNWNHITTKAKVKANIFHLRNWNKSVSVTAWQEAFHHVMSFIQDGTLTLMKPASQYELIHVKEAVREVEDAQNKKGKVFLIS